MKVRVSGTMAPSCHWALSRLPSVVVVVVVVGWWSWWWWYIHWLKVGSRGGWGGVRGGWGGFRDGWGGVRGGLGGWC